MRRGQRASQAPEVLWAWDRAITDFRLWHHRKQTRGIHFITRRKNKFGEKKSRASPATAA